MENAQTLLLQTAEQLIQENQIKEAIDFLLRFDQQTQAGIRQDVNQQSGNFYAVHQPYTQGLLDDNTYLLRTARIRYGLSEIVKSIPRKLELNAKIRGLDTYQFNISDKIVGLEKIIGSKDNLLTINWLEKALKASKAVCRVVRPDGVKGTGFLTQEGYVFTNNHVIENEEVARGTRLEFNYEVGANGNVNPLTAYELDATDYVTSPPGAFDFARVKVKDRVDAPLSQWGYVDFDPEAIPTVGDPVTIIQHPQGGDKRIALRANEVLGKQNQHLYYTTDTEAGSSGSPIFNQNWKVVAIHHAGKVLDLNGQKRDANEGILFRDIFGFITQSGKG